MYDLRSETPKLCETCFYRPIFKECGWDVHTVLWHSGRRLDKESGDQWLETHTRKPIGIAFKGILYILKKLAFPEKKNSFILNFSSRLRIRNINEE